MSALTGNRAMNSHHRTILERLISLGVVTHIPFGQWSKDGFEQMNSFQEVAQVRLNSNPIIYVMTFCFFVFFSNTVFRNTDRPLSGLECTIPTRCGFLSAKRNAQSFHSSMKSKKPNQTLEKVQYHQLPHIHLPTLTHHT